MYLIETLDKSVSVEDLGIVVTIQVPVWITEEQYKSSECLRRLERIGRVRASLKSRSRVTNKSPKKPRAHMARMSRPLPRQSAPPEQKGFSLEEVEELVNRAAMKAADAVSKRFLEGPGGFSKGEVALTSGRASGSEPPREPGSKAPLKGPLEPLYIPTGIVSDNPVELSVQKGSSGGEDLDAASSALKKMRERK